MADYHPLIARAVEGLSDPSPDMRRAVYERARTALIGQLRSLDPPLSEADIERETVSLDDAIRRVEASYEPAPTASGLPASPGLPVTRDQSRPEQSRSPVASLSSRPDPVLDRDLADDVPAASSREASAEAEVAERPRV